MLSLYHFLNIYNLMFVFFMRFMLGHLYNVVLFMTMIMFVFAK